MKTYTYHIGLMGVFYPHGVTVDQQGFVRCHDSPRYKAASLVQLDRWIKQGSVLVRNAAATEIANRKAQKWRETGKL